MTSGACLDGCWVRHLVGEMLYDPMTNVGGAVRLAGVDGDGVVDPFADDHDAGRVL